MTCGYNEHTPKVSKDEVVTSMAVSTLQLGIHVLIQPFHLHLDPLIKGIQNYN
jgi:hypothetical protein